MALFLLSANLGWIQGQIIFTENSLHYQIERFKAAGITHFCLGNSSPDVNLGIDVFKDVIPHVKN